MDVHRKLTFEQYTAEAYTHRQPLADNLPLYGIPPSGEPPRADMFWIATDTPSVYHEHGGHPLYGEEDIVYRTNRHGYRSSEFTETGDIKLLAVGCSNTFGVGVRQEERFSTLLASRMRYELQKTVVEWNLGLPARSPDYVARILQQSVPILNPDIVVVLFPPSGRREYATKTGAKMNVYPAYGGWDPEGAVVAKAFCGLTSKLDDQINLFRSYSSIRTLLKRREFLFSFIFGPDLDFVRPHLDPQSWVDEFDGDLIDIGRDYSHPGPETHRLIAELFWNKLVSSGGTERLLARLASVSAHSAPSFEAGRT